MYVEVSIPIALFKTFTYIVPKKYKKQIFLVKSNKEYDAISQEIDHMKTTISESETMQLQFEEEKTELEETIKLNTNKIEATAE